MIALKIVLVGFSRDTDAALINQMLLFADRNARLVYREWSSLENARKAFVVLTVSNWFWVKWV